MTRSHRVYNYVLALVLCAGIVSGALVLSHAHFNTMSRGTQSPPVASHDGGLPPVW
jgi:hypothetical protein